MSQNHLPSVLQCHRAILFPSEPRSGLAEEPGILHGAAANHHSVTAGLPPHAQGIFRSQDVSVPAHRDGQRLLELPDPQPVGLAGEHLARGPGMQSHPVDAVGLADPSYLQIVAALVIQSQTELHREGNAHAISASPDDSLGQLEVSHERGPGAPFENLAGGTAHVDVDQVGAQLLDELGGVAHAHRIGAVDLDGEGPLFFVEVHQGSGAFAAPGEGLGGDELHTDHSHAPDPLQDAAEVLVGDPGHGSQDQRGVHRDSADAKGLGHRPSRLDQETKTSASYPKTPRPVSSAASSVLEYENLTASDACRGRSMNLLEIQKALAASEMDAWLLFDFHGMNPIAARVAGLSGGHMITRRWFGLIPSSGEPVWLHSAIEAHVFSELPGRKVAYVGWRQLEEYLRGLIQGHRRVAMEYSPGGAIPYVSRVDGGTLEMVRTCGAEVVSSADLVQFFEARWSPEALASHRRSARHLDEIVQSTFHEIAQAVGSGRSRTEH